MKKIKVKLFYVLLLIAIIILIPLITNKLISFSWSGTVKISNKTQETWVLFYASWFSGIIGSIIGGVIAFQLAKLQIDMSAEQQRKSYIKAERIKIALIAYQDYKLAFQNGLEMANNIFTYFSTLYSESRNQYLSLDMDKYINLDHKIENQHINFLALLNKHIIIFSELDNYSKDEGNIKYKTITSELKSILDEWNKSNKLLKSILAEQNKMTNEEFFGYLEENLVVKLNSFIRTLIIYEKSFVKYYLSDIFDKQYIIKVSRFPSFKELNGNN